LSTTEREKSQRPRRGDVWRVIFDPGLGAEIQKTRQAVVLSSDGIGRLPVKLVAPITDWNERFADNLWHVRIDPDEANGLTKPSAADALQVRSVDIQRFVERLGRVSDAIMEEIVMALALVVEYQ
jgi:mRNA interferase MazF